MYTMHGALEPTAYFWHLQHISVRDTLSCTGTVTLIEQDGLASLTKHSPFLIALTTRQKIFATCSNSTASLGWGVGNNCI